MTGSTSITRRLIGTVLVLELLSAVALIAAITVHEWHVQLQAFDSSLSASAESLLGSVQDTEDEDDTVMLDMRGTRVGHDAVFRVEDERGRVLGSSGEIRAFEKPAPGAAIYHDGDVHGRGYRFFILNGLRIVDPGKPDGGVRHNIIIVYGEPIRHVWHEVFEAVRFFAVATAILLGITTFVMAWLVRKGLAPVHQLATEAELISSSDWQFDAPPSALQTAELRPLAEALQAALTRLRQSFEQQRRFTNDAAHELKTDVAIVKSSLQLLSMRKRTVEEYSRGLALSLDDVTRLETAVQKMLTLARLEQPPQSDVSRTPVLSCSLSGVIEDAVHQSAPLADLKAIRLNLDLNSDARTTVDSGDALLLCSNILLNALQHSPSGSTVRIALVNDSDQLQMTVQDEGEGISEQDRMNVFEPFYRGDPSRSRKSGGTGLGLSICKAICDRAGGSIEIANHPAGGACVTVRLPTESIKHESTVSGSLKVQ